jgi:hypothetical protein
MRTGRRVIKYVVIGRPICGKWDQVVLRFEPTIISHANGRADLLKAQHVTSL